MPSSVNSNALEPRLPPELLSRIFNLALTPPRSAPPLRTAPDPLLRAIARLSRGWTQFARSRLYHSIYVKHEDAGGMLLRTLSARPDLGALVRRLSLGSAGSERGAFRRFAGEAAGRLIAACPGLEYLSCCGIPEFERAVPAIAQLGDLRELVLDAVGSTPGTDLPPLHLPKLSRLTLSRLSPELPPWPALLAPSAFPNLRALALAGYDGALLGPAPGAPSIIARASSHYNDFVPDHAASYPPGLSSSILWQFGEFEATCEWEDTPERWGWSGLSVEHVRFERWKGRERYSHAGGNRVLLERVAEAARVGEWMFAKLKSIYLDDAPAESVEEQAALDAVVAECRHRGVRVVFEREPGVGDSWVSEHFLAEREKMSLQ